jgi:hypothetical protein
VLLGINRRRGVVGIDGLTYSQSHHEAGGTWQQDVRKRYAWTFGQARITGERTATGQFRSHTWQSVKGEVLDDDRLSGTWRIAPAGDEIHLYAIPKGQEAAMADWPPLLVFTRRGEGAVTPAKPVPDRATSPAPPRPTVPARPPVRPVPPADPAVAAMSQQQKNTALLGLMAAPDAGRAKALTAAGADPLAAGPDKRFAMLEAVSRTDPSLAKAMLGGVVDAESRQTAVPLPPPDTAQQEALAAIAPAVDEGSTHVDHRTYLAAASKGHAHVVALILDRRAVPAGAVEPAGGNGALHYAAGAEHPDTVRLLLERGLDPTVRNKDGRTPRDVAPAGGRAAELLLAAETGRTLLEDYRRSRAATPASGQKAPAVMDNPEALRPSPAGEPQPADAEPTAGVLATEAYRVMVPPGWKAGDLQLGPLKGKTLVAPPDDDEDTFRENVVILRDAPLPHGADAMRYLAMSAPTLKQTMPGYREIARAKVLLGDRVVAQLDYSYQQAGARGRNRAYFMPCDGYGYVLTCSARPDTFDRYAAVFQRIAESLTPVEKPKKP